MLSYNHVASGVLAGLTVLTIAKLELNGWEYFPGLILGSVAPDIDTKKSWVSQTVPLIDDVLRDMKILRHRGITHGITGIIFAALLYFYFQNNFMLGFAIGYSMHCITDFFLSVINLTIEDKTNIWLFRFFWIVNTLLILSMCGIKIDLLDLKKAGIKIYEEIQTIKEEIRQ